MSSKVKEPPIKLDWGNLPPWMKGPVRDQYDGPDDDTPLVPFWRERGFWIGFALGAALVVIVLLVSVAVLG